MLLLSLITDHTTQTETFFPLKSLDTEKAVTVLQNGDIMSSKKKHTSGATGAAKSPKVTKPVNQGSKYSTKAKPVPRIGGRVAINVYMLPLAFILGILPFIIYLKKYEPKLSDTGWFDVATYNTDLFLYYKQVFFIAVCAIMLCLIILQAFLKNHRLQFTKLFIPLAGYAFLSLLSSIVSEYSYFSFHGIFEQFESVWVLLGYALIVYYAYIFISEASDIRFMIVVLTVSTLIIMLLGLSQAFGHDFFRSDIAKSIILPEQYREGASLDFSFGSNIVYLTLYNPNYVGSYASLISPLFLMLIFTTKKPYKIALYAVIYVALLLSLLGSGSRAGLGGIIASLLLIGIMFGKRLLKYWMEAIIVLVLIVGTVYTMNNYSNNNIFNRVKSALSIEETNFNLDAIETNDDNIVISYREHKLEIKGETDSSTGVLTYEFYDENQNSVSFVPDESSNGTHFVTEDPRFSGISLTHCTDATDFLIDYNGEYVVLMNMDEEGTGIKYPNDSDYIFTVTIDGQNWSFGCLNNSMYYYNRRHIFDKMNNSETADFLYDYAKMASGRGFIWSKTLPLVKDTLFLGTGADTFSLAFPNNDYVAMYNGNFADEIMTKPHNMYLQTAVQTGVVSLICLLVFYIMYFVRSFSLYFHSTSKGYLTFIGMGILSGTFGYLIVGFINDSMITVAPLFWVLLGMGVAINELIKKEQPVQTPLMTKVSDTVS